MPTLTFLGHAGLRLATPDVSLLMDPWFASTGAFFGAWHQFPRNDHLDLRGLLDADWVAVSHEHLDHMDLSVLTRLPERTRVVIPAYPSRVFRDRLEQAGVRRIIEVPAWEPLALDRHGSWLTVIPEQSPMCHDAAFLVSMGGRSVLNCNDARLSAAQGRRAAVTAGGRIDVMAVQTSGASWHPICYEYPEELRRTVEANKRLSKFRAVFRLVRATAPRLAVPFAGPPCFLDEPLRHHNASIAPPGIFPDQEQAAGWLSEHLPAQPVRAFRPGDVLDLDTAEVMADPVSARLCYDDLDDYLGGYAEHRRGALADVYARHPEPGPGLDALFAEHFARLGGLSPWFLGRIGLTMRFDVTGPHGGRWDVRMGEDGLEVDLRARAATPNYRLRVDGRWLLPVLLGAEGWETLLLSLRISAWREPDVYNDYLVGLLKHASAAALQAVEDYETRRDPGERVLLDAAAGTFEIDRYCPHAGEDLTEGAVVEGDVLRCLAHNFEFDLRTGQCRNARSAPLQSALVAPRRDEATSRA